MLKLKNFIKLNPKEHISKGEIVRQVAMADLEPFNRDIKKWSYVKYKSGTKFRNGDILLARITPCLENGKTSFVNLLKQGEVAVGSTEFYVLRAIEGKMDPNYLYYLSISQNFRKNLIKSMTGTSGRQRVTKEALLNYETDIPDIDNQKDIGLKLRLIDDIISINNKINDNLTSQIKSISNNYFHLFKHYLYKNWAYVKLEDIAEINSGYSYQGQELLPSNIAMATIKNFNRTGGFNVNGYKEIKPRKNLKTEKYANLFDVLIAHTDITQNGDIIGNAEIILDTCNYKNVIYSMDLVKVTPKNQLISPFLLALLLQSNELKKYCLGYVNGTTVLHLNKKAIKNFRIPLPNNISDINNIEKYARYAYKQMSINFKENRILKSLKTEILNKYF